MQTTNQNSKKLSLGATVEMLCQDARAVGADDSSVADLAARRLERVLLRRSNLRMAAALAALAQELAPASSSAKRQPKADELLFARAA